jgi:hypothetical protein
MSACVPGWGEIMEQWHVHMLHSEHSQLLIIVTFVSPQKGKAIPVTGREGP